MTAYGPQGIPRGRAGGPGWPRSSTNTPVNADVTGFPAQFIIVRSDQQIRMPSWASFYRAGATGNGAAGSFSAANAASGGGGGAFSGTQTAPEKAAPGSLINVRFEAASVIVEVLGYRLSAGHATGRNGGVATGGAVNFSGGDGGIATNGTGSWAGGGSAASRAGAGVNAVNTSTTAGAGALGTAGLGYFAGSAPGGTGYPTANAVAPQSSPNFPTVLTGTLGLPVLQIAGTANACRGGDGGGGGGGTGDATNYPTSGGPGFAILEFW